MQVVWPLCLVGVIACSAPAKPAVESTAETVGELRAVVANDCPYHRQFAPWMAELFPACSSLALGQYPICLGSTCANPCAAEGGGSHGRYEDYSFVQMFGYDARGRLVSIVENGKEWVRLEYNGEHLTRHRAATDPPQLSSVTRNDAGRIVSLEIEDKSLKATYDVEGRLVQLGDDTFVYDGNGWLLRMNDWAFAHDDKGHVTKQGKENGELITYEYAGDRLVRIVGPGESKNTSLTYDDAGRLVRVGVGGHENETTGARMYRYDCGK